MTQYTGRVAISINGRRLRSKEGASLDIGGSARTPAISDAGVDGFVEGIGVPTIDFEINHNASINLTDLHAFRDGTAVFETDTGVAFTIRGAWSSTPPKLAKGGVTMQIQGVECIEG